MFVRVIALVMALAFVPAFSEVIETAVHAVEFGDAVHAADEPHGAAPLGDDEHGCSPTLHLCGCCAPAPVLAQVVLAVAPTAAPPSATWAVPLPVDAIGRMGQAPPTRPPIA